ncbi:hypothetical protein DFQ30_006250, partial [Apophysomyces sp. BC1015]
QQQGPLINSDEWISETTWYKNRGMDADDDDDDDDGNEDEDEDDNDDHGQFSQYLQK